MRNIVIKIGMILLLIYSGTGINYAGDGQIDIAYLPYTIDQSGSYIVVKDITLATQDTNGIIINVDNVTIDLNGHTLTGQGKAVGTIGSGITVNGTHYNIAIKNGTLRDWRMDGVSATYASNSQFESLRCYNNGGSGLMAGSNCKIIGNTSQDNGEYGISVSVSNTIVNNSSRNNGKSGIYTNTACVINGNSCYDNTDNGISASSGSTVINNSCYHNGKSGISAMTGSNILSNSCNVNLGDGIQVNDSCKITDNICNNNGYQSSDGAGIHSTYGINCIEHNVVCYNDRGIDVDWSGSYIASNRAKGNTTNYDIAASNTVGTGDLANITF